MMTSAFKPATAPADLSAKAASRIVLGAPSRQAVVSFLGNGEPDLDDVMGDPMIRGLMARDGVVEAELRSLLNQVRERLV